MRSHVQTRKEAWTQPCVELRCLNTWILTGDTVWVGVGCYGTFRRYSLAGRRMSLHHALRVCSLPQFQFTPSASHLWLWVACYGHLLPCLLLYYGYPTCTCSKPRETPSISRFWSRVFLTQQKRSWCIWTLELTHLIFTEILWGIY